MAIEAVIGNVQLTAYKPFRARIVPFEHAIPFLEPVEFLGNAGPELFRICFGAVMLVFGLVLSIALMCVAATNIARLLERHRWLSYLGLAIITLVALTMIWEGAGEIWAVVASA